MGCTPWPDTSAGLHQGAEFASGHWPSAKWHRLTEADIWTRSLFFLEPQAKKTKTILSPHTTTLWRISRSFEVCVHNGYTFIVDVCTGCSRCFSKKDQIYRSATREGNNEDSGPREWAHSLKLHVFRPSCLNWNVAYVVAPPNSRRLMPGLALVRHAERFLIYVVHFWTATAKYSNFFPGRVGESAALRCWFFGPFFLRAVAVASQLLTSCAALFCDPDGGQRLFSKLLFLLKQMAIKHEVFWSTIAHTHTHTHTNSHDY